MPGPLEDEGEGKEGISLRQMGCRAAILAYCRSWKEPRRRNPRRECRQAIDVADRKSGSTADQPQRRQECGRTRHPYRGKKTGPETGAA